MPRSDVGYHAAQLVSANAPTPGSGSNLIYPKSDGRWYSKNSAGVETPVSAGIDAQHKDLAFGGSTYTVTTTMTSIGTNSSVTITSTSTADQFEVIFTFDVSITTTTTATTVGQIYVDGVAPTPSRQAFVGAGAAGARNTSSQTQTVTGLSAGDHVISLWARKTAASGVVVINTSHTSMMVNRVA